MPRFFVAPFDGEHAILDGEDARHIVKSLRMEAGDGITLCDGQGVDYDCEIASADSGQVVARVLAKAPSRTEPKVFVRLYQALPKGDKLDFIVQKAVELGVREIVPVLTERCVSRPDEKSMAKKTLRLQKIALEAAKQSGRGAVPRILPLCGFAEAIGGMKTLSRAILLYERATSPLSCFLSEPPLEVGLMVGSEGGFSEEEAAYAQAQNISLASLGSRILRCETAPVCALSAVLYACGEF